MYRSLIMEIRSGHSELSVILVSQVDQGSTVLCICIRITDHTTIMTIVVYINCDYIPSSNLHFFLRLLGNYVVIYGEPVR